MSDSIQAAIDALQNAPPASVGPAAPDAVANAIQMLQSPIQSVPASPTPNTSATPAPLSWSDVPGAALSNIPSSAMNFAQGIGQAVMHPINTIGSMGDAVVGELQNALPKALVDYMNSSGIPMQPGAQQRITDTASNVGNFYKNRYGSIEGLKNTLATDPVGAAADASAVLGGTGAALGGNSTLANALATASKYTNPVTPVIGTIGKAADLTKFALKHALGMSTQVGAENVANAAKAGYAGDSSFMDNLKGSVPMSNALDQAQSNLALLQKQNSAAYRSGMIDISADKSMLDFGNIMDAIDKEGVKGMYKGQVINTPAAAAINKVDALVQNWRNLPPSEYHTPEGMDKLKQQVGGVLESIPYTDKTARSAVGGIYGAIKGTIQEQAPTYAKVMQNYSEGSDLVNEIQKTLSLNPTASVDTAMRKLQSLARNNVNTNYGNRLGLANTLANVPGGTDFMPALSGQAMNSWTPRGLGGTSEAMAAAAAAMFGHPEALLAAPFMSPRLMGAGAYGAGRIASKIPEIPAGAPNAALAAALMGRQQ